MDSTGQYILNFINANGCDSALYLNLVVNMLPDTAVSLNGITVTAAIGLSYQWLDCGNNYQPISGATSQSYTPATNGSYAVEVNSQGCIDTSTCIAVIKVSTKTVIKNLGIKVYPNPSSDLLIIHSENLRQSDETEYAIRNTLGQVIAEGKLNRSGKTAISIDGSVGIYFLELVGENGQRDAIQLIKTK